MDYEKELPRLCLQCEGVLSGFGGLTWHHYLRLYMNLLVFATTDPTIAAQHIPFIEYRLVPELDTQNFLVPCKYNPKILIPTVERSIVMHQMYDSMVPYDDEFLMMAMQNYRYIHGEEISELLKVADFYGRRAEILKSWVISENFDPHEGE